MRSTILAVAMIMAISPSSSNGFSLSTPTSAVVSARSSSALEMAKGAKGFGNTPSPKKKAKPKQPVAPQEDGMLASMIAKENEEYNPFDKSNESTQTDTSRGKAALDRMRREQAEQRNAELQKMKEVQEVDQMMLETGGEAAVIPEKVAQRMGKRMLPFVGIPLFGSIATFVGFWYMATYQDMEFQPVLVAGSTIAFLAIGLVGITYSMMSASWDPEREGSILGTDEFSRNIDNIKGGLSRSRENAQIREQIMIEKNKAQPFKPETFKPSKPKKSTPTSLSEKLGDEFD